MNDLEQRLRSALSELADEVPPSRNAHAEHLRRVTVRRRRRPLLAAAAAAVVFGIAVMPAAIKTPAPQQPAAPSNTNRPSVSYDPMPDGPFMTVTEGPVVLGKFSENGKEWQALVFLERHPSGTGWANRVCVVGVAPGAAPNDPNRHPNSTGCEPMHQWPVGQPPHKVETRSVLGGNRIGGGPFSSLLLFITAPEVSRLDAREAYGLSVGVRELGRTDEFVLFLADFGTSYEGFGYTAWNAQGEVVESAIT
jgi:hypothetical protein